MGACYFVQFQTVTSYRKAFVETDDKTKIEEILTKQYGSSPFSLVKISQKKDICIPCRN
jgi:hypothetical protein